MHSAPARGADGAVDTGEGLGRSCGRRRGRSREADRRRRRRGRRCRWLRERAEPERELEMCGGCSSFTRSLTHSSSSYPNGSAKGGPNSLAGPNSPYPTSRPASLIGLIVISHNLSDDKVSNRSKLIEGPYRAPSYDKDD